MTESKTSIFRKIENEIKEYEESLINFFANHENKTIYELSFDKDKYISVKWDIQKISVFYGHNKNQPKINKRATDKDIKLIKEYFEEIKNTKCVIIYHVKNKDKYGVNSRGISHYDIDNKKYSFTENGLDDEIARKNKEYEEVYKPREGYTACAYCRKQVPNDRLIKKTIIGRGWDRIQQKQVVTREVLSFCSSECAFNEQCSREG